MRLILSVSQGKNNKLRLRFWNRVEDVEQHELIGKTFQFLSEHGEAGILIEEVKKVKLPPQEYNI